MLQDVICKIFLMIVTVLTVSVFPNDLSHYWQLPTNRDSQLENQPRSVKHCSGICKK